MPTIATRSARGATTALGAAATLAAAAGSLGAGPVALQLSDLDGTSGFVLNGTPDSGQAGRSLACPGDVNGDGVPDAFIGAYAAAPNGFASGAGLVFFGPGADAPAIVELAALDGTDGFAVNGAAPGDFAGISVGAAGDMNADGHDDLVIGAYAADPNGLSSGSTYVIFGTDQPFPPSIDLGALDGTNGFRLDGETSPDRSGRSVATAGDVNGDRIDDLLIGAYNASPNGQSSGRVYVVFGSAAGFPAALALSTLSSSQGFAINGVGAGDQAGICVAAAGDVNDDGLADILVGANSADANGQDSGAVYVIYGRTGFPAQFQLANLNGGNGFVVPGAAADDGAGTSASGAGDVNGDGLPDLIIGAARAGPNGDDSGAAYVVYGGGPFAAVVDLNALDGSAGVTINGAAAGDLAGFAVAGGGDFNGDGVDDVVVGAFRATPNGADSGAAYVVLGRLGGLEAVVELAALDGTDGLIVNGVLAGDEAGRAVAMIGDLNGDGLAEVMVGSPDADPNGTRSGTVHVLYGSGDCNGNGVLDVADIAGGASADANDDGRPDECDDPCPADLDGSGDVGFDDLLAVLSSWGPCAACPEDLDGSGDVGFDDLLVVLSTWGKCGG